MVNAPAGGPTGLLVTNPPKAMSKDGKTIDDGNNPMPIAFEGRPKAPEGKGHDGKETAPGTCLEDTYLEFFPSEMPFELAANVEAAALESSGVDL